MSVLHDRRFGVRVSRRPAQPVRWLARLCTLAMVLVIVAVEASEGAGPDTGLRPAVPAPVPAPLLALHLVGWLAMPAGLLLALVRRFEAVGAAATVAGWGMIQLGSVIEGRFPLSDLGILSLPLVPAVLFLVAWRYERAALAP